jgi:hypothetical protein
MREIPETNNSWIRTHTVKQLLYRVRRHTSWVYHFSSKIRIGSSPGFYYRRDPVTGKNTRQRNHTLRQAFATNRLVNTLIRLETEHDLKPRIYRYLIWRCFPMLPIGRGNRIYTRLNAIVSRWMFKYYDLVSPRGREMVSIRGPEDKTIVFPRCFPRLIAYKSVWSTIVDQQQSQTPL